LKFLQKRLMRGKVPQSVLARRKEGFDIPAHEWLRGRLRELLLDTVNEETVGESGVFQWAAVEPVIQAHMERRANFGYHLWGLLTLFLWMKQWKIQSASTGSDAVSPMVCVTT
jgi:asparagine synthase (glutamine-hydrolysing)